MSDAPPFWRAVDPGAPWLAPHRTRLVRAITRLEAGERVADVLNALADSSARPPVLDAGPLRFVPQAALPGGEAYEAFIARHAQVPTRDNLHDLFNGLAWLAWPALKRRLNERQAEAIARDGIGARRGPVRDALTLIDENGAWLQAPAPLADALRARDWPALFGRHRGLWAEASLVLLGHALLEQLVAPRKPITAHVWLVPSGVDAEAWLLAHWTPERLAAKGHHPLPVLGVPGWWAANAEPGFYDDPAVFRPRRG